MTVACPDFERFVVRAATRADQPALLRLAGHLNSVNLPNDPSAIRALLETSQASFEGAITDPTRREYVLLVEDRAQGRVVGTSMVLGQLGRRDAPYIYFDVRREEKYSATLDRHFVHTILGTTYCYDGPTELGGLVVDPGYRGRPEGVGRLVSYARFLLVAARREDFRDELLAELMPPLESDGTSLLWEAVGRRFTDLSYQRADKLSRSNKEFIRNLFPNAIYATLLPPEAQAIIGEVGSATRGVAKMLTRVGFRYAQRVDPFDGGPHYLASTDAVPLVGDAQSSLYGGPLAGLSAVRPWMLAQALERPPYFVCRLAPPAGTGASAAWPGQESLSAQGFDLGQPLLCVSLP